MKKPKKEDNKPFFEYIFLKKLFMYYTGFYEIKRYRFKGFYS